LSYWDVTGTFAADELIVGRASPVAHWGSIIELPDRPRVTRQLTLPESFARSVRRRV